MLCDVRLYPSVSDTASTMPTLQNTVKWSWLPAPSTDSQTIVVLASTAQWTSADRYVQMPHNLPPAIGLTCVFQNVEWWQRCAGNHVRAVNEASVGQDTCVFKPKWPEGLGCKNFEAQLRLGGMPWECLPGEAAPLSWYALPHHLPTAYC
jgi:hypothetical protein